MTTLDGPQWRQLPMLMTPEELGGMRSGDLPSMDVRDAAESKAQWHGEKVAALDKAIQKTGVFHPVQILHGAHPGVLPGIEGPFLANGHHRAAVALSRGMLTPVTHHETMDPEFEKDYYRKWGT